MRRLILFRHAKAENSPPGGQDRDRVLLERGREDAANIGVYMAKHRLAPDQVALSPAARTRETWKLAGAAFKPAPSVTPADALYDATRNDIFDLVKATPATAHTLLVIGHNPGLHDAALMLIATGDIGTRERLREGLPTAGLVVVDFAFDDWGKLHPQSGRLERFVSPKSIAAATN
ncbi:MAG: histidine phosphatase family protein [Pseudolabrys sp.]